HVPMMFSILGDALPQAQSGSIRVLAVSSERRSPQLPDVPTISESGFPGFRASAWNGLMAPAGTPQAIINRIAVETARVTKEEAFVRRLANLGVDTIGSSPAEFAAMISADMELWADALKLAGISLK